MRVRAWMTLLLILLLLAGCSKSIPQEIIDKDLAELEQYIAEQGMGFGKNEPYRGVEEIKKLIAEGKIPDSLEDWTQEAVSDKAALLVRDSGTKLPGEVNRAAELSNAHPNWTPEHTAQVVIGEPVKGMNQEQVQMIFVGKPNLIKTYPDYNVWWYKDNRGKYSFLAFTKGGILFYYSLEK